MKNRILGTLLFLTSTATFAAQPGGPNCGWGNMLFEGSSGLGTHIVALTTNGISGNNTFGMTLGTNGCDTGAKLTYGGDKMMNFGAIMDEFSEDVARGEGEALTAVAVSLGIQSEDRATFKAVMHQNFQKLFPNIDVQAEAVMETMVSIMQEHDVLSKYFA